MCGNKGKRSTYICQVERGGWFLEQIWERSTGTTTFRNSEMGTTHYTRRMVWYTLKKFWGLARMQKDDVHVVWKASDLDESRVWQTKQPTHPPFQRGTCIWYATCMNAHCPHDRKHDRQAGVGKTMAQTTPLVGTKKYVKTTMQKHIHTEAFDKVREALNAVHHVKWTDWDLCVPTFSRLTGPCAKPWSRGHFQS